MESGDYMKNIVNRAAGELVKALKPQAPVVDNPDPMQRGWIQYGVDFKVGLEDVAIDALRDKAKELGITQFGVLSDLGVGAECWLATGHEEGNGVSVRLVRQYDGYTRRLDFLGRA